jgi:hypothetical protein
MIRRNVASQTIYLPQLVLAADGAAVTSSATLTVAKDGTEAASAGTLAHVANGVWKYTPTQAETDAAIVGLVLTATNAVPVVLNLVTTAADTQAVAFGANTTAPDNATIGNIYTVLQLTDADVATLLTRIVGTLASGTHQPQSGDSFARLGAPDGASIAADIAAIEGGGGGGDATEAKQDEILAAIQGAQVVQVPSPNVLGNLVLTQGDTYDGIGNPKAQWNVTTNYTDGWGVSFTIRDKSDNVVYTNAGTVASATLITVDIDTPTGLPMVGCPGSWEGKYDVELVKNQSVKTIAIGKVFINEDQTR